MTTSGISQSQSTERILRMITLTTPIFIATYLLLGGYHIFGLHFDRQVPAFVTNAFVAVWLASGLYMSAIYNNTTFNRVIRMTFFHILGAAFLVGYLGLSFPIAVLWIILVLAQYTYFGYIGGAISLVALVITTITDITLFPSSATGDIAMCASITILSIALIGFLRVQERDEAEFELAKRAERLQRDSNITLINNLTDAVVSTDKSGKIKVYNAAMLNIIDTNQSIGGQSVDAVLKLETSSNEPVKLTDLLKEAKTATVNDSLRIPLGEDDFMRLEITYTPIRKSFSSQSSTDGGGYVIIIRDITKTKSLEEERDEFISVVSHELRTPITIAEGTVSNLQLMNNRGLLNKSNATEAINNAHDQIVFLAKMVNDLSTLSRAERGVADAAERIDLSELIHGLYTQYAPQAEAKGLRLDLNTDPKLGTVFTSRLYLQELMQNFITNAIKYTQEGSITIEAHRHPKLNQTTFTVRDTGIGIGKLDLAKIFNKFYRAEDYRTRETSGTGLGLYVAAKLAKKLGTEIDVQSRLNHGSTFSISLPLETPAKTRKQ